MYDVAVRGPTATMEATETAADLATSGGMNGTAWGAAAAQYRQLLQHQHQHQHQHHHRHADDEGALSDPGSSASRGPSPRHGSDTETIHGLRQPPSPDHGVLEKLRQQVASVTQTHSQEMSDDSSDYRLQQESLRGARAAAEAAAAAASQLHQRHPLSPPQSLLAASMASNPPSLVPLPGLGGLAGYGGSVGRPGSASPPAREAASPPGSSTSASHSPRQPPSGAGTGTGSAPWNYEEQFKQLYEIDDNPKRKEFLDELFQFMHNRGTPINRLPIMAKQVLDMYELYNHVVARGGLVEVINKKLWQEIIKGLKLPSSITSAAFTLRTQYMKYLYPHECQKVGLSSPSDLQAAIDGNRREGRRGGYSAASYVDFSQRNPLINSSMAQSFGLPNGMPTTLHQQGLSPLSLVTSRPGGPASNGPSGYPMPPSSPFLPGLGGPVMPSANDTLMTLWNLYSRQQQQQRVHSPPSALPLRKPELSLFQKPEGVGAAPQSEALNLGVQRDAAARDEREREIDQQRERELAHDRENDMEKDQEWDRHMRVTGESQEASSPPPYKKPRLPEPERKADAFPHTKMSISTKGDSSIVVSMELNGVGYQGVLFAQPPATRV